MAQLDGKQRIVVIQRGLEGDFWREYLQPLLLETARQRLDVLLNSKSEEDERTKGFVQGLRWVLSKPQQEIDNFVRLERDAQREHEVKKDDDFRADFGFRSPYRQASQAGDTKLEEPEPPTAQAGE